MTNSDYWVSISSRNGFCGAGFLLTRRWVLTAAHCLKNRAPLATEVQIKRGDGDTAEGVVLEICEERDTALIQVTGKLSWTALPLTASIARKGDEWLAPYRPPRRKSTLQGTVLTCPVEIECATGGKVEALELYVRQYLGNYAGYSGSPVEWDPPKRAQEGERLVIGMLIEQQQHLSRANEFTNILYAITLRHAMEAFDWLAPVPWMNRSKKSGDGELAPGPVEEQFSRARLVIAHLQSLVDDALLPASDVAEEIRNVVRHASTKAMRGSDASDIG